MEMDGRLGGQRDIGRGEEEEHNFTSAAGQVTLSNTERPMGHQSPDSQGTRVRVAPAGVALAASPISLFIAESLKPLRDFFLVMFFFSVGATFNFGYASQVVIPSFLLAGFILILKPLCFSLLFVRSGEKKIVSKEVGIRLGQGSEFSLLVGSIALTNHLISDVTSNLIQATTILTFIVSSYVVVMKYPTPMSLSDKMRKD